MGGISLVYTGSESACQAPKWAFLWWGVYEGLYACCIPLMCAIMCMLMRYRKGRTSGADWVVVPAAVGERGGGGSWEVGHARCPHRSTSKLIMSITVTHTLARTDPLYLLRSRERYRTDLFLQSFVILTHEHGQRRIQLNEVWVSILVWVPAPGGQPHIWHPMFRQCFTFLQPLCFP